MTANRLVLAACLLAGFVAPPAHAQLDTDEQKCVNALNTQLRNVAKTQGTEIAKCIKDGANGKLGDTIEACVEADAKGKVGKARDKTDRFDADRCSTASPAFGATDATTVNDAAEDSAKDLAHDLFGPDLDAAITSADESKDGAKCQQLGHKAVEGRADSYRLEFNKCKKLGLKDGSITTGAELEACLGDDPKGKIAKRCDTGAFGHKKVDKIRKVLDKNCDAKGVDLAAAFPGCGEADGETAHGCLHAAARCRTCIAANDADGLDIDCDSFDDGDANESCDALVLPDGIWFVDAAAAPGGDGSFALPFRFMFEAAAASATGDTIFAYASGGFLYDPMTLKQGQTLLGEEAGLTVTIGGVPVEVVPAGAKPNIFDINVPASDCTVKGFAARELEVNGGHRSVIDLVTIAGSDRVLRLIGSDDVDIRIEDVVTQCDGSEFAATGVSVGSATGSLTIEDGAIDACFRAVNLTGGGLDVTLRSLEIDTTAVGSSSDGIRAVGTTGDILIENFSISNTAGDGMRISHSGDVIVRNGSSTGAGGDGIKLDVSGSGRGLIDGVTITGSGANGIDSAFSGSGAMTIRNTVVDNSSSGNGMILFSSAVGTNACADVSGNSFLNGDGGTIWLITSFPTLNMVQTSNANLSSVNGGATWTENVQATLNYGGAPCALPVIP